MFAEPVNNDEHIVVSVFVFIERTEIHGDMFPRTGRNRKRVEESGLLVSRYRDAAASVAVAVVLLYVAGYTGLVVLRREEL